MSESAAPQKDAASTLSTIKDSIGDLLHLNVLTVVGDFALTDDHTDLAPGSLEGVPKVFTRMGLLDGDIKTAMSEVFVTDAAYAEARRFHQETVSVGTATVARNVAALRELVSFLRAELSE